MLKEGVGSPRPLHLSKKGSILKLLIATGFRDRASAYSPYLTSLVNTIRILCGAGVDFEFMAHNGDVFVDRFRNTVCAKFLEGDFTDLLFIDADVEWDLMAVSRLLTAPYEVVGGTYPMKHQDANFPISIYTDEKGIPQVDSKTGMIRAAWLPAGFLRIKRLCLEKMAEAYKDLTYQDFNADPVTPHRVYIKFFETQLGVGGEDLTFCKRWRDIGGEIWLEPNITFSHYGVQAFTGNYHEFLIRQPGGVRHGLKTLYIANINDCIPDLSPYFESHENLRQADAVIIWNDIEEAYKDICQKAKAFKIPTFVMQHGVMPDYVAPLKCDYSTGVFDADYYLVWSDRDKQKLVERGCQENRLFVVGCSLFKHRTNSPDGKTVVFFPDHATNWYPENHQTSVEVWNHLREIKGINPLAKLLVWENRPITDYKGSKIVSDRFKEGHLNVTYESLKNASCIVSEEASTNVLLACQLDIPFIKIKNNNHNYFPNVSIETELDKLESVIKFALNNPSHLRKERQAFASVYDHGDCAKNIHETVMSILDGRS